MDRVDALGPRRDRLSAFTRELLAEADDRELTEIVRSAAAELSTPIAMVNLVLERIQFFKAHYGLPADLAVMRGTTRDVSFCQFVVRDGAPFEVNDAEHDERVPQALVKEYGIMAYLGVPVMAQGVVVGSLCVIDTKPREFSDAERESLNKLALLVNARLDALAARRLQSRQSLIDRAATPGLTELRRAVISIPDSVRAGRAAATTLAAALRHAELALSKASIKSAELERNLESGRLALRDLGDCFDDVEAGGSDAEESLIALQHVLMESAQTRLSHVATSGRELARHNVAQAGGVLLDEIIDDPVLATARPLGVAVVANALSIVAARMVMFSLSGGLRMDTEDLGAEAAILIRADGLRQELFEEIAFDLTRHTREDPLVDVEAIEGGLRLTFTTENR